MCCADWIGFFYRFQVEETTGNRNDLFFINNNQQVTVKNKKWLCPAFTMPARLSNQGHTHQSGI